MKKEICDKKGQQNTKKITYTTWWVISADEIDLLFFIGIAYLLKQTDFFYSYCLKINCNVKAQYMFLDTYYHLTAVIFKDMPFIPLQKVKTILNFFPAPEYVTSL